MLGLSLGRGGWCRGGRGQGRLGRGSEICKEMDAAAGSTGLVSRGDKGGVTPGEGS